MRAPSSRASSRFARRHRLARAPLRAGSRARSVRSVTRELFVGTPEAIAVVPDDLRNSRADDDAVASAPQPRRRLRARPGASRAARHPRRPRWYVTAEDGAKELAKWQIETANRVAARTPPRANSSSSALNASLTERLRREHDARRVLENSSASRSPRPSSTTPCALTSRATRPRDHATRVFRALETRVVRDRAALEAADDREPASSRTRKGGGGETRRVRGGEARAGGAPRARRAPPRG